MASITVRRRVEWMDTDAAGIYHWTTIARFAESAEAALHGALGIAQITFGFTPRLSVQLSFARPLRFADEADVTLTVAAVGRSSLRYALDVRTPDGGAVAAGEIVVCFVAADGSGSRPWPDAVREALLSSGPQPPE